MKLPLNAQASLCSTLWAPANTTLVLSTLLRQIKGLSNWATAQAQRADGEVVLERHHPRLIMTLIRCMRLSFTGSAPVADGDAQYAQVEGAGAALVFYVWSANGCTIWLLRDKLREVSFSSYLRVHSICCV